MIVRDLLVKLGVQSDTSGFDAMDRKVSGLKSQLGAVSVAAGNIVSSLVQAGFGKAVATIKDGVDQTVQFGREMANVSSLIGGDKLRTNELAKDVERLSLQYGKSTTEINDALYDLIGTLGDSKQATAQLEIAMKLGAAGAGTTKDGLRVLTAVTKAYGDTSIGTMQKVADLSSQTVNLGQVTLPELASSIGIVTPLAATLGISIEEVMANTATLTGVTGTSSEVMHQLSSAMRSVIDRSKPMEAAFKKAFKKEHFKSISEAIAKYGMVGTLQRLVKTTDGTIESVNGLFGRIEGLNEALAVGGRLSGDFAEKQKAMGAVAGTVDSQYRAQTTGLGEAGHAMDVAKAKNDALARMIGEKSIPAFMELEQAGLNVKAAFVKDLLPIFTDVDSMFGNADDKAKALHATFKALEAVVVVLADALDAVVSTIKGVFTGFEALFGLIANIGDLDAMGKVLEQAGKDYEQIGAGFTKRVMQRHELLFEQTPETMRTKMQMQQLGLAPQTVNQSMGNVNINVTAAPGTEASAVARELDTVARNYMDVAMQQALVATNPAGGY